MDRQHRNAAIAVALLVGGLVCLVAVMLGRGLNLYMGVDELVAAKARFVDREMRLAGFVADRPQTQADGSARFTVETRGASLPVAYEGALPANLEPGREVLLDGRLGGDGVFHAHTLLTQCSSRYREKIGPAASSPDRSPEDDSAESSGASSSAAD
ncbi:MAG: cytochrome c maturation protein CcmE [Planctomycetes bacterium]|nr:cytochrome c maturation protein CcmE [Planctomycetota bacterium]